MPRLTTATTTMTDTMTDTTMITVITNLFRLALVSVKEAIVSVNSLNVNSLDVNSLNVNNLKVNSLVTDLQISQKWRTPEPALMVRGASTRWRWSRRSCTKTW